MGNQMSRVGDAIKRSKSPNVDEEPLDDVPDGYHRPLARRLRLILSGFPVGVEPLDNYEPDGYHPIHLGDRLDPKKRYKAIHKLGHGSYATVWLCRDLQSKKSTRYVAVKVLSDYATKTGDELKAAGLVSAICANNGDIANLIAQPLDLFRIDGPNGSHQCLVYSVMGPRASLGFSPVGDDPDKVLKDICASVVKAVGALHENGLCHGDLTPKNILLRITGFDGLKESELLKVLGKPQKNKVVNQLTLSGTHDEPCLPKYLVYPIDWCRVPSQFFEKQPCIIDFGEAFPASEPPKDLGTPVEYCAPELMLENKIGPGCDLWALGCILFEIRTGRKLVQTFFGTFNEGLEEMVQMLGKFPEPWWSTTWEDRKNIWEDEPDARGHLVRVKRDAGSAEADAIFVGGDEAAAEEASHRSLSTAIAEGVKYYNEDSPEITPRVIPEKEAQAFADILGRLLCYEVEDRAKPADLLKHEWFRM